MTDNAREAIKKIMEHPELTDEMEKVSPGIKAKMVGYLLSSWLPRGAVRKITMIIILLAAIIGSFSSLWFLLLLIILPLFSPRAVGKIARLFGKFRKKTRPETPSPDWSDEDLLNALRQDSGTFENLRRNEPALLREMAQQAISIKYQRKTARVSLLVGIGAISASLLIGIISVAVAVWISIHQRSIENESSKEITVELLSSEIENNLYDILGDEKIDNIKGTHTALVKLQGTTLYSIRGTIKEFYDRNSNNLTLLNTTTTMPIINFYHLLKTVDEDITFIESIPKENDNLDSLIKAYENLIEDTRKARLLGSRSLALLKYYYDPEYLRELVVNPEAEKIISKEIETLSPNATTTAEKILQNHNIKGIINEVLVEFLFLKSEQMKLIDKDQGIYQHK